MRPDSHAVPTIILLLYRSDAFLKKHTRSIR
jgi:hypothetical protein